MRISTLGPEATKGLRNGRQRLGIRAKGKNGRGEKEAKP
jgi:hypothetical protein